MRFDYSRDPLSPQLERLLAGIGTKEVRTALAGVGAACIACCCAWAIESGRAHAAAGREAMYQAKYAADRARVQRIELTSAQTTDLLDLEHRLQTFRISGYRCARMLATLGTQLPAKAWLVTLAPRMNETEITGRAFDLATIGDVLEHLTGTQLGQATLQHVDRIEAPGMRPQLEFTITLQK